MTSIVPGKTPRKAAGGGRFHTIATSTPSKSNLKSTLAIKNTTESNSGLISRGGDIFDLTANETDDPAGPKLK